MEPRYRKDWDQLARREPYFAVLTDSRYLRENLDAGSCDAFFESGDADVEGLMGTIGAMLGRPFSPASALDFGCGVGRLTVPLARRVSRVAGFDIAPAMLNEARENTRRLGLSNVTFVNDLDTLTGQQFDLICSLLVFQHIPVHEGLDTLTRLLNLLSPGGVAAIHFLVGRPGSLLRRFARQVRSALPLLHRLTLRLEGGSKDLPYMQMNAYDRRQIEARFADVTGTLPHSSRRIDGEMEGSLFIAARPA